MTDKDTALIRIWLEDAGASAEAKWALERIESRLTQPVVPEWRTIDSAPKDGTQILAFYPYWNGHKNYQVVVHWCGWGNGVWQISASGGNIIDGKEPTHWKPLPQPPIQAAKDETNV